MPRAILQPWSPPSKREREKKRERERDTHTHTDREYIGGSSGVRGEVRSLSFPCIPLGSPYVSIYRHRERRERASERASERGRESKRGLEEGSWR